MKTLLFIIALWATPGFGETLVAARTIRSQAIITAQDVAVSGATIAGTYLTPDDVIGQEARVVIYVGRPIRLGDVGPPALVDRNQIVTIVFNSGGLRISAEARALGRGGIGDRIRVMNLASRTTVTGTIQPDASIIVSP